MYFENNKRCLLRYHKRLYSNDSQYHVKGLLRVHSWYTFYFAATINKLSWNSTNQLIFLLAHLQSPYREQTLRAIKQTCNIKCYQRQTQLTNINIWQLPLWGFLIRYERKQVVFRTHYLLRVSTPPLSSKVYRPTNQRRRRCAIVLGCQSMCSLGFRLSLFASFER